MSNTRGLMLVCGMILGVSGLAVSGLIKRTSPPQKMDYAGRNYDNMRGQTGFLLGAYKNREVGTAMMGAGGVLLVLCAASKRWL
jgi:hypothetical protein